jgi:Ni/Co efflux regulator RcnB
MLDLPVSIGKMASIFVGSFFVVVIFAIEQTNVYIPLWIALIVALPSTITPMALSYLQAKARRKEKEADAKARREEKLADWKRQDEVAKRVERVALAQVEVAKKVEAVAEGASSRTAQLEKLSKGQEVIHSLVDGQLTAQMQAELDTKMALLISLNEVALLKKQAGVAPSEEATEIIAAMKASIAELKEKLASRRATEAKMKK